MSWKRSMAVAWFAAGLAACGGSGKGSLTVSAKSAAAAPAGSGSAISLDAGNGILIDEIRLVVRKLEVEGPSASCSPTVPTAASPAGMTKDGGGGDGGGGSDDGAEDESCEIEQGPFLVVLSGEDLLAGTHPMFDATVPAGTYEEVALRFDTLTAQKAATAPIEAQRAPLADMAARNVSLEVRGTLDGTAFTFAAPLRARQKREGAITVDPDNGADLTFTLDASRWFGPPGAKLDPTDPANQSAILANVRASLRLVHDEDHDGSDDELDDHGNDGPGHT